MIRLSGFRKDAELGHPVEEKDKVYVAVENSREVLEDVIMYSKIATPGSRELIIDANDFLDNIYNLHKFGITRNTIISLPVIPARPWPRPPLWTLPKNYTEQRCLSIPVLLTVKWPVPLARIWEE